MKILFYVLIPSLLGLLFKSDGDTGYAGSELVLIPSLLGLLFKSRETAQQASQAAS